MQPAPNVGLRFAHGFSKGRLAARDIDSPFQGLTLDAHAPDLLQMLSAHNNLCSRTTIYVVAMGVGDRIILLRNERGWSQRQLAEAVTRAGFKITQQGIDRIEKRNSERPRGLPELLKIFNVSEKWLLTGKGERSPRSSAPLIPAIRSGETPIVGYVGAGERVFPFDDHAQGAGLDTTEQPPGEKGTVIAVIVRGDSMEPIYRDGDLLFYAAEKRSPADLVGLDCIVKVHEGPTFVKTIRRHQKRGHFTLKSYNAEDIGPVQIETAYPVRWVKRKG